MTRVIGVVSGKGGVGKSVTAVNLAVALNKMKYKTLLVDADLTNPSVGLHLGLVYGGIGLQDVLNGVSFDQALVAHSTGLRVIPSSLKYDEKASLKNLKKSLSSIKNYDFIVVDSPPGITSDVSSIIESCTDLVVITTPEIPAVTSAAKILSLSRKSKNDFLVVNRSTGAPYEITNSEIEEITEASILSVIPEDKAVMESVGLKSPILLLKPSAKSARSLSKIALNIAGKTDSVVEETNFLEGIIASIKKLLGFN